MLTVFGVLLVTLLLFIWGKFRHDLVAVAALMALVFTGWVSPDDAFKGFAHPAVVTVAVILIVSYGLQQSGLVDAISSLLVKAGNRQFVQISLLCLLVTIFSAFMNNVGALAILMPVAIHMANQAGKSPSSYLMPLAFASLFGGMTTLIGTPPNIIISAFRERALGEGYTMFEFGYVGLPLAIAAIIFLAILGWRMLPKRKKSDSNNKGFKLNEYVTEVLVTENSTLIGKNIFNINELTPMNVSVLSFVRNNRVIHAPRNTEVFRIGDVLMIEADAESMKNFIEQTQSKLFARQNIEQKFDGESELKMMEAVVMTDSPLLYQTASGMRLRDRYKVNLLAISRAETRFMKRLDHVAIKAGDVLLLHGYANTLPDVVSDLGCLPLANRNFDINKPKKIVQALVIFLAAIVLVMLNITKVQIAFTIAALAMILLKIVPLKNIYRSIDGPVIILLGAMLPLGDALEKSGGAAFVSSLMLQSATYFPLWLSLMLFMLTTMLLSGVINNAATVVIMAPIGLGLANGLGTSPDVFLMATAVGASCAFLTPIGHQSNTLVMGPGGYKFFDYVRLGLPLTILSAAMAVFFILHFWQ